ncbi:MAG TPA: hypothetical protein VFH24_04145 [Gemmatimonadales bacterium]|nr:hypothetical protein [Gemmatimonadales bacterium]
MRLKTLLTITAVYLAVLGLGFIFAPLQIGAGAIPPDAPPALIAYARQFGAPLLGIAVLNWTARNAGPSPARNSIILGNIVGFGVGPFLDVWGLIIGARQLAVLFATIHLLVALAFIWAWRSNRSIT